MFYAWVAGHTPCYVIKTIYIYHLFTETEGNSVFCGPQTAVVARGEAEGNNGGRVAT
jgi:hypothetical protein